MPDTSPADPKQLLSLIPILFVADIAGTIQYYQETLGFQKDWDYGGPTFYASVSRDGIEFHLRQIETPRQHIHHEG